MGARAWPLLAVLLAASGCPSTNVVGRVPGAGGAGGGSDDGGGVTPVTSMLVLQPGPGEGQDAMAVSNRGDVAAPAEIDMQASAWTVNGAPYVTRGYIKFDLSALPAGAHVMRATLTLFADPNLTSHSGVNDWAIYPVIEPWDQATLTWSTQPAVGATPIAQLPPSSTNYQDYDVDVTGFVVAAAAARSSYQGFMMRLLDETPYRKVLFCTSDHPEPDVRPRLVIEYVAP